MSINEMNKKISSLEKRVEILESKLIKKRSSDSRDEKWDELVQLLLNLRENIESERKQQADDLGLTQTELAFYNILLAEVGGSETPSQESQKQFFTGMIQKFSKTLS